MKESEIRPKELFNKYLTLSQQDGNSMDHSKFIEIDCPACGHKKTPILFKKNDYSYKKCNACFSLFCSPRPSIEQLNDFYFNSESSKFWSNIFFPTVKEARRDKLFKPKAQKIINMIESESLNINNFCDVGAGHGLLLEEISKISSDIKLYAIEPDSTSSTECRKKGIEVLEETSENSQSWHNRFDMVISSEVIEHVYEPNAFIKSLYNLTNEGGYTLITGLGYEGFDILTLQEKSNSVSAPHHLNFMSIEGFKRLFENVGFKNVKVWTPGRLDVDIVLNSNTESEFMQALKRRGPEAINEFQQFLVKHNLSSHTWILAKK